MIGRRRDGVPTEALQPGDYKLEDGAQVVFRDPKGNIGRVRQPTWKITVHPDRSVTVSPAIHVNKGERNEWHGYLERGVWRNA